MTLFSAHGICYIIYWASTHQLSEMLKWGKTDISNLAGELALLSGLVLWIATFPKIRRKMFELFFYTHHFYILFVVFFVFHVGVSYACIMLPGFFLFMVDRFLRFLQSRSNVRLVSARVLPCETLELNFSKTKGKLMKIS
nr:ferric reduction oxidase 3, mitochondrial-like [Solanum lycopersicum]